MSASMPRFLLVSLLLALLAVAGRAQQISPAEHRELVTETTGLRDRLADLLCKATHPVTRSEVAAAAAVYWTPNAALEAGSWRLHDAEKLLALIKELKDGKTFPRLTASGQVAVLVTELEKVTGTLIVNLISPDGEIHQAAARKVAFAYDTAMLMLDRAVNEGATPLVPVAVPLGMIDPGRAGNMKLLNVPTGPAGAVPTYVPTGQPTPTTRPPGGFIPPPAPRIPGAPPIGELPAGIPPPREP